MFSSYTLTLTCTALFVHMHTGPCFGYAQQQSTPQFHPEPQNNHYSVPINQNYIIGSTVIRVGCSDSLHNATDFVYGIISSDNYFTINNVSGVVSLVINARDLPGGGPYNALIYCKYNDNDRSSTIQLAVSYRIENMHVPVFTYGDQVLNVSVREDHIEREGPAIAQLNVTDDDLEPCNIVTFAIISGNTGMKFRIGSQSGVLELNDNLDYETHSQYTLTIQATNTQCGERRYSDRLTVCVYVIGIDDEHPTFQQHMYAFTFDEGQRPLNFVQLRCTDSDSPGAQIVYDEDFLQSEIPFTIDYQTGYVSATQSLDYEQHTSYNLTFICYSIPNQDIRDMAVVTISVNPINEHLPLLTLSRSYIQLDYMSPLGTLLASARNKSNAPIRITAMDSDRGGNHGKIRFTLVQNNDEYSRYFHMDAESGDLALTRRFDFIVCNGGRVRGPVFIVRLVACDDIQNSSRYDTCSSKTIAVSITATLDTCKLRFLETNYSVNVSESAIPGSKLLQVHCVVPGGGPTQNHTIRVFSPSSTISQNFSIYNDSVILQQNLDYELLQNFTVWLNCSDSSGQISITSLFIQVLPENDNPPYFEKPLYFFTIIVPSSKEIIASIIAMDDDLQIGNNLTYSLVRNEFFEHDLEYFTVFTLENGSAAISMIKVPSHDGYYVFDIIANDSINIAWSMVLIQSVTYPHIISPSTGTEQCGTICIVLIIILVTFMLTTAAVAALVCVRFYCTSRRKQEQELRPVAMANTLELQDKSDTMGYSTIRQGNSIHRQKDAAFSQMYVPRLLVYYTNIFARLDSRPYS